MTDDELRRKLGNKLGWDGSTGYPSLSELVATGEGRLAEEQRSKYGDSVAMAIFDIKGCDEVYHFHVDGFPPSGEGYCKLITAPAAVRAMALLEVLE